MARIVQKYGGTSVGDVDRIKNVAARIKAIRDEGNELVVVVSARAGVTNELIARAKAVCAMPSEREMDQLLAIGEQETIALTAMALHGIGVDAVSYTGAQAGIFTDKVHTKAKIMTINAKPLVKDLKSGKVRALAVTSSEPSATFPGLPTVAAAGLPGYEALIVYGMLAPAHTPAAVIGRLNRETVAVLRRPDVREKFVNFGVESFGSTPEEFAALLKSDLARMGKVIKDAGIRVE